MRCTDAKFRLANLCWLIACIVALSSASRAWANSPTDKDVKVLWADGYPKKDGGKLKFKGTVEWANGWESANSNKVNITIWPTNGGVVQYTVLSGDSFEGDMPLTNWTAPAKSHGIAASVQAKKPPSQISYPVTSKQVNLDLP